MTTAVHKIDFGPTYRRLLAELAAANITPLTDVIEVAAIVDADGRQLPPMRHSLISGERFARGKQRLSPVWIREQVAEHLAIAIRQTAQAPVVPVYLGPERGRVMARIVGYALEFVELKEG